MERRISPERRAIIDYDPTIYALPDDPDIHAADQASVIVKKIDVRPSETLWDKDGALVGAQDQINDVWVGY